MKKVLIIEDDPAWAEVLVRYVQDVEMDYRVVMSGDQAMEQIDIWQPDALVLDMLLAGETGVALLNELRSHDDLSKLPVVVCSNLELEQAQLAPFGVQAVLNKAKTTPGDIRMALRKALV